jgi:hypothetical protein
MRSEGGPAHALSAIYSYFEEEGNLRPFLPHYCFHEPGDYTSSSVIYSIELVFVSFLWLLVRDVSRVD